MAAAAPYVTVGDTPNCDACGRYYSERHCEDCGQYQCTWCNLDIHQPIGKRNHWRPRLYGEDPHAHLERNATASADEALEQAQRSAREANAAASSADAAPEQTQNRYTYDATTQRVNVTTEHFLPLAAEDAWDLLGDWDLPFVPFSCDATDSGDRRVLTLPPDEDSASSESTIVTERLIQRSERDLYYSYSRAAPSTTNSSANGLPYTELLSKYAFVPLANAADGSKRCVLQWTTSVLPRDPATPKEAAESVARFQESWRAYFDAAIQMED